MTTQGAVVILSGLPGAGKTHFARALAALTPIRHIESDAVRRSLFVSPRYSRWESSFVFREVERLTREALADGAVAVIDATNLTRHDRRRFFTLATRMDARVLSVRLVAPDVVIRGRLASPRDGHSQADVHVYESFRDNAQPFTTPLVVVDTRFPLAPSLRLVTRLLRD